MLSQIKEVATGGGILRFRKFSYLAYLFYFLIAASYIFISKHPTRGGNPFTLNVSALCIALAIFLCIWKMIGREEIEFTPTELIHKIIRFGSSRMEPYRVKGMSASWFDEFPTTPNETQTAVSFYYEGDVVRVFETIKQSDANQVVAAILTQYPELRASHKRPAEVMSASAKRLNILDLK